MATPVVSEAQVLQPKRPRNTVDDTTHVAKRTKKAAARNGATSKQVSKRKPKPTVPKSKKAVHGLLKSLGVENPTKVSNCLKAGIYNERVREAVGARERSGRRVWTGPGVRGVCEVNCL